MREGSFQKALTLKLTIFKDVPSQPDQQSRKGSSKHREQQVPRQGGQEGGTGKKEVKGELLQPLETV